MGRSSMIGAVGGGFDELPPVGSGGAGWGGGSVGRREEDDDDGGGVGDGGGRLAPVGERSDVDRWLHRHDHCYHPASADSLSAVFSV